MILDGRSRSSLNSFYFLVGQIRFKRECQNDGGSVVFVAYHLISLGEKLLGNFCDLKLLGLL